LAIKIIWNKEALENIAKAIEWISQESELQAEKVEAAILTKVEELVKNPEKYPPDKLKADNNGNYRAFGTHSCRISYRYAESTIRILRIRHVKQKPKEH
jgi:plasmid stabilization system protein ParE